MTKRGARIEVAVLNIDEAANYLRVSRSTVWRLFRDRKLTRVRVGTRTLVRKDELDALIQVPGNAA